jgi:hypothetical protein
MKVRCTGLSSPSYAEEQALKRMTGPYQHTKKSRIGNRKRTLFFFFTKSVSRDREIAFETE